MPMFRKKPVVIEAVQWPIKDQSQWPSWLSSANGISLNNGCCYIDTLEGEMCASPGDWIIRGVKGELYPCKPDIFAATYEEA